MPWKVSDVDQHKRGLTKAQKEQWVKVANSALKACLDDGGSRASCEGSAVRQANGVVGNNSERYSTLSLMANNYIIRTEYYDGRKHLVVPVVMMREGVHSGSHGPLLHPISELGKFPEAWNGIPVVIQHPEEEGHNISANAPRVLDRQAVGRVFNAHIDGDRLKAEAWIEESKAQRVSPEVLGYLSQARPLDVSVGVFTEDEYAPGIWKGERYTATARNHRPDHLALLPGGTGACSWADGCGVRVNAKKEGGDVDVNLLEALKALSQQGYGLAVNEIGMLERAENLRAKLDRMDDDRKLHFIQEVFDDYCIYEVRARLSESGAPLFEPVLYKRDYTMGEGGEIEFTGEAIPVRRQVEYVTMEYTMKRTKGGKTMPNTNQKTPCCPEKVNLLIQSKHTEFAEEDREWLNSLEQGRLDKMVAPIANMEAQDQTAEPKAETTPTEEETKNVGDNKANPINKEEALAVLRESLTSPEQFLSLVPKELKDQFESGLALHQQKRADLIASITGYSKVFSEEELNAKPTTELEKLAGMVPDKSDFSPLGVNSGLQGNASVEPLLPPGVTAQ